MDKKLSYLYGVEVSVAFESPQLACCGVRVRVSINRKRPQSSFTDMSNPSARRGEHGRVGRQSSSAGGGTTGSPARSAAERAVDRERSPRASTSGSTGDSPQHREARASAVPITGRRPALSFAAAVHPAHAPNSSPSTNAAVAPTAASVDGSTVNLQSAGSGNAQACRTFYSRSAFSGFPAFASLLTLSVAWVAHATFRELRPLCNCKA